MKRWNLVLAMAMSMAVMSAGCDPAKPTEEAAPARTAAPKSDADDHDHDHAHDNADDAPAGGKVAVATITPSGAATTQPSNNNVTGVVTFTQVDDKVQVVAEINGLTPNTEHGFHIHEKGDLSAPDLTSAGPHFNPAGHKHGGPESDAAHAGDLGNVKSDGGGHAHLEMTLTDVTLGDGPNSIIGRSVIVHGKSDDLKTDPAGNAGARIAGGVIQLKQ
jgi:Cu-Zn family superoxide dismutase